MSTPPNDSGPAKRRPIRVAALECVCLLALFASLPAPGSAQEPPAAPRARPEARAPGPPVTPQQLQQRAPAGAATPALAPLDVLALAEAAPHGLEDEDVRLLGQLRARLLSRGDALEPMLPK